MAPCVASTTQNKKMVIYNQLSSIQWITTFCRTIKSKTKIYKREYITLCHAVLSRERGLAGQTQKNMDRIRHSHAQCGLSSKNKKRILPSLQKNTPYMSFNKNGLHQQNHVTKRVPYISVLFGEQMNPKPYPYSVSGL